MKNVKSQILARISFSMVNGKPSSFLTSLSNDTLCTKAQSNGFRHSFHFVASSVPCKTDIEAIPNSSVRYLIQ